MQTSRRLQDRALFAGVAGVAYTFEFGPTLTVEYLRNGEGYDDEQAQSYEQLLRAAKFAAEQPGGTLRGLVLQTLEAALLPNQRTLRRDYVSAQLAQLALRDEWDLFLRYTHGLDDSSGLLAPVVQWNATDQLRLFAIGAINLGEPRDEFGRLFRLQWMAGLHAFVF